MEQLTQEIARLKEEAGKLSGATLDGMDSVVAGADDDGDAIIRAITEMTKSVAVQVAALWGAVDLVAAHISTPS